MSCLLAQNSRNNCAKSAGTVKSRLRYQSGPIPVKRPSDESRKWRSPRLNCGGGQSISPNDLSQSALLAASQSLPYPRFHVVLVLLGSNICATHNQTVKSTSVVIRFPFDKTETLRWKKQILSSPHVSFDLMIARSNYSRVRFEENVNLKSTSENNGNRIVWLIFRY